MIEKKKLQLTLHSKCSAEIYIDNESCFNEVSKASINR